MRPLSGLRFQISSFSSAFTLIEVLVASAILAFLLVVFLSVASFASQAWRGSQQKMEEFSTARIVMNRIRSDLESIVIRPDLPLFPSNAMGFMTVKRGNATDARLLSYVEYSTNGNQVILSSRPYTFSTSDSPPFSTNSDIPAPTDTTSNVLANGVIGFQTTYLNKITGTNGVTSNSWSTNFFSKYSTASSTNSVTNSVAVRVSLLVVSSEGLKHLQDTKKLTQVTAAMALTNATNSPEEQWNSAIKVGGDIDIPTASSLRAFERVFFLPN